MGLKAFEANIYDDIDDITNDFSIANMGYVMALTASTEIIPKNNLNRVSS